MKKKATDYYVKDLALADFGRKEIELAEHEMPGLMALRALLIGIQGLRRGELHVA
jgi:adenosylhomocysteinase